MLRARSRSRSAEELIAYMQGVLALDDPARTAPAEPALADGDTPRLVADIDKDVAASAERAEGHAAATIQRSCSRIFERRGRSLEVLDASVARALRG